ncbi:TBC1 domain family member 15 isoform X1 [Jatropha curcas]|uniref:TBC1 domain family member 15 isoform X1 n=1 Tax=Jatropha curcas TaxID=180498 RepID=UPI001893A563|nr:TBC1 domain family member 15 isoform X1 [Jatropha curcas]
MQEPELHDLADDADYAASIQQGSASVMVTSDSSKRSTSSEPDGAEVVYRKDNVAIHPTQFASERIGGRLKLIKQDTSLFMTWIPYKGQSSNARLSERDRNLYTIRAVPFTDVRSIRRHTPTLGWQYVIVVLSSGLAFPPLYFYNGGVKEFLATVKQHVFIVRSLEDANVFLVNDFQNPLQRTLSSLELPRAVPIASGRSASTSAVESSSYENQGKDDGDIHNGSSSISQIGGRQRQKSNDPARDLSIQVLEKFSLVTKFARDTTSQLFRENHNNGLGSMDRKNYNHSAVNIPHKTPPGTEEGPIESPVPSDPIEKYLCRKHEHGEEAATNVGPFQLINFKEFDKLTLVWGKPRQPPLGSEEWATFLDSEGRVMDSKALRKRIFYGGVEHTLRREVWAFLLGYHAYDSTYAERECLRYNKKLEYETVKKQWQSISPEQAKRFTKFRERKGLVDKDVVRTDRSLPFYDGDDNPNVNVLRDILLTYSFYNFDLGYCQGMSDLLSPILFVMEDESESFWCFVALMERLGPNFNRDQSGMHSQLFALSKLVELLDSPLHNYFKQNDCLNYFFCFRWILIQFKREFEYEKTIRLWEVLWTHYLCEHLHLYACVAILKRYRNKIMGEQMDFDTLLKFINELSGHIDLDAILRDAEALCICAGENGAACVPPGTPPSLPPENENGLLYTQQDEGL